MKTRNICKNVKGAYETYLASIRKDKIIEAQYIDIGSPKKDEPWEKEKKVGSIIHNVEYGILEVTYYAYYHGLAGHCDTEFRSFKTKAIPNSSIPHTAGKVNTELSTGYVYAPYIPLVKETFVNDKSILPERGDYAFLDRQSKGIDIDRTSIKVEPLKAPKGDMFFIDYMSRFGETYKGAIDKTNESFMELNKAFQEFGKELRMNAPSVPETKAEFATKGLPEIEISMEKLNKGYVSPKFLKIENPCGELF